MKGNSFYIIGIHRISITILTNVERSYKEKHSEALQEKNEVLFEKKIKKEG